MRIAAMLITAITGTIMALILKNIRPEAAFACGIVTAVILMTEALSYITGIADAVFEFAARYGVNSEYIASLARIVGITCLAQFGVDTCKDAGQTAIASQLELCGRVLIIALALPAVVTLMELGASLLGGLQ
ncbi:MAG TPA: stage III sporulation AC/AD family protein [Eubacteriales bacterium]|jgi:stage III sporulation protein AD|nr:stage III sporulation AC/AD family protein [Clostridia bacterium]HRV72578.1 stage III sporulation AC/AD family protein [Eubacteriales bacterium]